MDYLWTPWRYQYLKEGTQREGCVFCEIGQSSDDASNLVVHRATSNYVVLNRYPYTSGHVMIVPYEHCPTLESAPVEAVEEMARLTQRLETVLRQLYRPAGLNIGMNVGEAAGAGVAGHIHMHVLPRWVADSNFATVIGETRILPEELPLTWKRLHEALQPSTE